MVPRSYAHASSPPSPKLKATEKGVPFMAAVEGGGSKGGVVRDSTRAQQRTRRPGAFSPPPSTPSKPVVIPTRTRYDGRPKSKDKAAADRMPTEKTNIDHNKAALSPSVTALLAMTSIPIPKRSSPSSGQRKALSMRHGSGRAAFIDAERHSLSSSNPQTWDFLLSPPDGEDLDSESFSSDTTIGPPSSVRSFSTDSMPSLEEDEESLCSASDPATPAMLASNRGERKKSLSTSKGKDCQLDHPLLPPPARTVMDIAEEQDTQMPIPGHRPAPLRSRTSFKSNLTASFRAVRSAARSISDWTMASNSIHRDDYLSQSLLSLTLPYTVERRPLPSNEPPNPALRRYLNPTTPSPTEFHFHEVVEETDVKACIQMETYQRGSRPSQHASSPPIFLSKRQPWRQDALDTEDPFTSCLLPRQREPRENSDFLRMIVLEMNMRKVGKLATTTPGRAKLWLPARQMNSTPAAVEEDGQTGASVLKEGAALDRVMRVRSKKVPPRWVGVTAV